MDYFARPSRSSFLPGYLGLIQRSSDHNKNMQRKLLTISIKLVVFCT
jgi:hypothetical protein